MPGWLHIFDGLKKIGESIGWLANIVQVAQVAGVIWAIILFLRARSEYKRRSKMLSLKPADGAVAIAIGVGTHIEGSVKNFLDNNLGAVDGKPKIQLVSYDKAGYIKTTDFLSVLHEIRNDIDELRKKGDIREVHLFYGGPYAIAAGIGAIMDNWVPVHIYMFTNKTYEYAFTLSAEMVKGI